MNIVDPILFQCRRQPPAAAICVPGSGIGLPVDASVEGHRIDWLMGVTNVMTGVLFVIMTGWLNYILIVALVALGAIVVAHHLADF